MMRNGLRFEVTTDPLYGNPMVLVFDTINGEEDYKGCVSMTKATYNGFYRWLFGNELIQDAMPFLSADDRELLMTGITPGEWDDLFYEDMKADAAYEEYVDDD